MNFSVFLWSLMKMMKKRKWRKKMKFSMNFWLWSLWEFCFLISVPLTLWLSIWNDTSVLSATSSSVCHIDVFVTDDDGRDQNQNVITYKGCFIRKKDRDEKQKYANLQGRFTYLSLFLLILASPVTLVDLGKI